MGWSSATPAWWLAPWRAAAARRVDIGERVGQAHHQHAMVQERQHHRDERGFLAAVQAAGGGEHARRLADERAAVPEERSPVEEVLERRRHVAEARRAAERETGAFLEVAQFCVRRAGIRRRGGSVTSIRPALTRGTMRTRAAAPGTRSIPDAMSSAMRFTEPPTL